MRIKHIMKDGTIRTDIDGLIVKRSEAKTVYTLIDQINKKRREK